MAMRRGAVLALLVLVAATARGEDNCSQMVRTMSRFLGTVRSVEPLATAAAQSGIHGVDLDPLFLVTIHVLMGEGGEDRSPAARAGESVSFAIHSPSRTFGTGDAAGRTFNLEAERMDCDGAFRRFLSLQVRPRAPLLESFDGMLEVGHLYRASVHVYDDTISLVKSLEMPMHHEGGVIWINMKDFPQLKPGTVRDVTFEVTRLEITMTGKWQWEQVYYARIHGVR